MDFYNNQREQAGQPYFQPRDHFVDRPQEAHGYYPPPRPPMYQRQKPTYQAAAAVAGICDDPLRAIKPSSFPLGTDPRMVEMFNRIDRNRDGIIDPGELQAVLSSWQHRFDLRTVHLLMYLFTNSSARMIGPEEFVPLFNSLQNWKGVFERSDRDRNGRIDVAELRAALYSMGYPASPALLNLLISKFDRTGRSSSISFDNFIECCLTIKGLSDKFKAKEDPYTGEASFTYDEFLACVIPLVIA